jgi:serine/threonine-protein kinase HipA
MTAMQTIHVWINFPNGEQVLCGEIVCEEPDMKGRVNGAFRYVESYLNHSDAFPLDPVSLPLTPQNHDPQRPSGVFAVFEDSLPDDWGRRLLIRKMGLRRNQQKVSDLLLAINGHAMGALSFSSGNNTTAGTHASIQQLDILLNHAAKFESGEPVENSEIAELLKAGSSPGGARPKVLICDGEDDYWIAKFPSIKDRYSIIPIEHAAMQLAGKAGIPVPETRVLTVGGRNVLLVKRFDVSGRAGRYHMISFRTLLRAEGWYHLSYRDLAGILKVHSYKPEKDLVNLFRQMTFNAYIGNTDDHLQNFSMLHSGNGYYLSPAYDLLADVNDNRTHVLNFDYDPAFPGYDSLVKMGKSYFGIATPDRHVDSVKDALKSWKQAFRQSKVPARDIELLAPAIDRRLLD